MNFDLRLPIGIMFSLFGVMLTIAGAVLDRHIYESHSLGFNINLIWGLVLLLFGICMLALALRSRDQRVQPAGQEGTAAGGSESPKK